ncbi:MAG TPA: ATP-binding protein [Pseudonocardia sp.]|jgi:two-component system, OmpR family, sensor histidine kinase MtrB|nr:ATP-binding protein [Pseudonocardia sp.]
MSILRLSVRQRVALTLGGGSLVLTSVLAAATWNLAAGYLADQRLQSAARQAEVNVRLVDGTLAAGTGGLEDLLTGLTGGRPDSSILLERRQGWTTTGRQVAPEALPDRLVELARQGVPSRQRVVVQGLPVIAVAFPTRVENGVYVELFDLGELDRTIRFLSGVLVAGTVASALFGVALGSWAGRRALRPLTELTAAAGRIAGGDLAARLPAGGADPDLAQLAATFNATAEDLQRRVRRDARFAVDVSHELRSPLTTMVNAAEVLNRRRGEMPPAAARAVELLTSEIDRFQRMVVDLLEISRDDAGATDATPEDIDLADLVRNVAAAGPAAGVPVEVDARPPLVRGDRRRLDRVVANLLDNAERHGGGAVRIAILRRAGKVLLEIDDAGPGVPPEFRERVFERFARGELAGARGDDTGSGLGLALVAEHVARGGGCVRVQDAPAGGARFVVELGEVPR